MRRFDITVTDAGFQPVEAGYQTQPPSAPRERAFQSDSATQRAYQTDAGPNRAAAVEAPQPEALHPAEVSPLAG